MPSARLRALGADKDQLPTHRSLTLAPGEARLLGRRKELRVRDPEVSRKHALVALSREGVLSLEALRPLFLLRRLTPTRTRPYILPAGERCKVGGLAVAPC